MLRIGITGQSGFIGTHLANILRLDGDFAIVPFRDEYFSAKESLQAFAGGCDAIVHLAAVNRHADPGVLYATNVALVEKLIAAMRASDSRPHVVYASSTQEDRDTPYGRSKRAGREMLSRWAEETGAAFTGLLIPNVYGPFGRPQHNSVVATFCHQLTHGETPEVATDRELKLIYVGELAALLADLIRNESSDRACRVPATAACTVSDLLATLSRYRDEYLQRGHIPRLVGDFELNLFRTFQCFIEPRAVRLPAHSDQRGTLVELLKTGIGGQVSCSTTRPGKVRGNHFHLRKLERFMVIRGDARVRLRQVGASRITDIVVSGDAPAFVDIPIWYVHDVTNVGSGDLSMAFWTSEAFDPADPDTYPELVEMN